jgi:hypothetical protein
VRKSSASVRGMPSGTSKDCNTSREIHCVLRFCCCCGKTHLNNATVLMRFSYASHTVQIRDASPHALLASRYTRAASAACATISLPCMTPLCPKDFRELPARLLVYLLYRHVQPLCVCRVFHFHRARGLVRAEPGRACVRERIPRVRAPRSARVRASSRHPYPSCQS